MKPIRPLLLCSGTILVGMVAMGGLVYNSAFQTWAARKAIASQPGLRATVGSVSAGLRRVRVTDVRFEQDGALLTVPLIEVDLPLVTAGMNKKVLVSRLVAKGWTLNLAAAGPHSGNAPVRSSSETVPLPQAAVRAFAGVFAQFQLLVDGSLDGVDLEGEIVLPDFRGRMKLGLKGGGFAAGREGKFDVVADAVLSVPGVNALAVRGALLAAMDTPRTFTRLGAKFDAAASGAKFPVGVRLSAELAATRATSGETYDLTITGDSKQLLALHAGFPRGSPKLDGTWKLDARDTDIAPFALGKPLPAFSATGEGRFDTDAAFAAVHATGRLSANADRLQAIMPELAVLGELRIAADFDLAVRGDVIAVLRIEASIDAARPVAIVRSLQPFEFNPQTGELRAADSGRDLLGVALRDVPVAWAKPFLKDVELTGGYLRGEFAASPRGGGVTLRSTVPLTLDGLSISQAGKPQVQHVDLSFNATGDYTPKGWQAEINALTAIGGGVQLLTLDAKAGQLAGKDQPLKVTGKIGAILPPVLAQPIAQGVLALTGGNAAIEFVASIGTKQELHAKISLLDLAAMAEGKAVKLPALAADVRADVAADGKIEINAPIVIEIDDRKSDLTLIGTVAPERDKVRTIEANVVSTQFIVGDAQIFAAILPAKVEQKTGGPMPPRNDAPPWAGLHGTVTLKLKRVVYSDTFEASNVSGRLKIDAGMVKLEGLQAGLGESGRAQLNGTLTFDPTTSQPYALAVDVAVKEFDPGPLFRALNANRPATVEGKFDVSSKLAGRAAKIGDLASGAGGDFQLTSKGGVFRGFPVTVSNAVETTGKLAGMLASAGSVIGGLTGKKEYADIASKAQAVAELSRGLNPIVYDQLSVVVSRDAAQNAMLKEFTLISPEVRLTGSGTALHKAGASLFEDSLAMEFKLRARGRQGELLKYLGALEPQPDAFGYLGSTLPLKIGGTLGKPDTAELNGRLAALALEKSGVTEKAADLFNKVFGK
ncbi:MAG: hypothetical protein EXS37_18280 [Opitutus sp.]|nr:hypothetical protein [Opitutus sp.]